MRLLTLLMGVVGLCLITAVRADDAVKDEMKKLGGTWIATAQEKDGEKLPQTKDVNAPWLNLKSDGKYQYQNGDQKHKGSWKCDPNQSPCQMDLTPDDGKTKPMQCIYQQKDNQMQICISPPGKDRPSQFTTKQGTGQQCITYKKKR